MAFRELHLAEGGGPWRPDATAWRPASGGPWRLEPVDARVDPADLAARETTLWRYHEVLPFTDLTAARRVGMGEGWTPLVDLGHAVLGKVEFASPTLSFKDRGAAVLVAAAVELGVERLVCDSSGNAGTAIAAYAARAGIACTVFVPASTSPAKLAPARAHGAHVVAVPGDRAAAGVAAVDEVERTGAFYASHVWNPLFLEGTKTYAYEVWEQLGFRAPGWVAVPVGNGTLLLGVVRGFEELRRAGLVDRVPEVLAVQASGCAPVWEAVHGTPAAHGPTVAEGIAIAAPPRLDELVRVVREAGARVELVADDEILGARDDLARRGLFVEPTAAACWAAVRRVRPELDGVGVVPLCGAGLKATA